MKSFVLLLFLYTIFISEINCLRKQSLDSSSYKVTWTLENKNKSISVPGSVPGGVYTDLHNAGIIGDILSGYNDVLTRWVSYDTWTYTGKFNVSGDNLKFSVAKLVLEGVDTVAFIELNGSPVGSTKNMFVRYGFDVKEHLKVGENELKFTFESPIEYAKARSKKYFTAPECVPDLYNGECHANQIRKMQASFSWDWGPAFPSVGIWRSASLEFFNGAIIRSFTTHIEKKYSTWFLKVKVYLETGEQIRHIKGYLSVYLSVEGHQTIKISKYVDRKTKIEGIIEVELDMNINENLIREWWPNGYGSQSLYNLLIFFTTYGNWSDHEISYKHGKIGFRTLELVEQEASLILVDNLLLAARDTHMAMLRVWGGGIYESDYFYRRCDELGILVWQDFLFACSMYPADPEFLENVDAEIEYNVLRLQHHPSIAVWAGNNENEVALRGNWYSTQSQFEKYKNEYIKLYVETIKPIVEDIDPGRRYLVSSPSNGRQSEQDGYIAKNPYDPNYGDTHYYNYLADNWDQNIYPQTRFASEYGFQSLPSIQTMRMATNNTSDYKVDSDYSKHRQHSPNGYNFIKMQMNRHLKLNESDPKYFEKFVFYSQITQAMAMKAETEFYRQSQADWYTMGALYWQLNDVWQAPSWSGIEYGGKWKMLHYFAKSFFAPVLVSSRMTLTSEVNVYLINDRFVPIYDANITVETFNWTCFVPIKTKSYPASVAPLSSKKQFTIDLWDAGNKDEIFLKFTLNAEGVVSSPSNCLFPVPLKNTKGLKKPKLELNVLKRESKIVQEFTVNIKVDVIVLFLWLEADSIEGHFEDNGLIITKPETNITFITRQNIEPNTLQNAISYQYYEN